MSMYYEGVKPYLVVTSIAIMMGKFESSQEVYSFLGDYDKYDHLVRSHILVQEAVEQPIILSESFEEISSAAELITFLGSISTLGLQSQYAGIRDLIPSVVTQAVEIHAPRDRNVQRDCALALTTFIHAFGSFLIK